MALVVAFLGSLVAIAQTVPPPGESPELRQQQFTSAALAYQANREAFRFGTFRFKFTRGSARSNEAALAGQFSSAYTAAGLYVFDGKNSRFEHNYSVDDLAKSTRKTGANESRSVLTPLRMLCNGDVTFADRPFLNAVASSVGSSIMIHAGALYFKQHFEFPLWLGQDGTGPSDIGDAVKLVKDGKCTIKDLDCHSRVDDADVCKVVLDLGAGRRVYWLDLNRGAIPLRVEDFRGSDLTHIAVARDIRFLAGAGWLPMTEVLVMQNGKVGRETRITEADVSHKPDASAFQLDFPSPVDLYDDARKLKYSPRKTWSLLELPGRVSPSAEPFMPKAFVPEPELPREVAQSSRWPAFFFASAVVLILLVSVRILVRRYRRG
jgi:hypothetical protein